MNTPNKRAESISKRRGLIVESAAMCFVEKGFHQTGMRDVAKRAGISLGNLYNHFESKAALIAEIATLEANELDILEQAISEIQNPVRAIERFVALYFDFCFQPENIALTAEVVSEGLRNQTIREGFLHNRTRLTTTIASLIKQIATTGDAAPKANPRRKAESILDLIEGFAIRCAFEHRSPARGEIGELKHMAQSIAET